MTDQDRTPNREIEDLRADVRDQLDKLTAEHEARYSWLKEENRRLERHISELVRLGIEREGTILQLRNKLADLDLYHSTRAGD